MIFAAAAYPLAGRGKASVVELVAGSQQALDTQRAVALVVASVVGSGIPQAVRLPEEVRHLELEE